MKTLDEIIKRNDYVRVTEKIRERAHELARIILHKIVELDLEDETWCFNGHNYKVRTFVSNQGTEDLLCVPVVTDFDGYSHIDYYNLHGRNGYLYGDYMCPLCDASNSRYRDFLNDCKDIFAWLYRVESQKVSECEEALKNAEGLK